MLDNVPQSQVVFKTLAIITHLLSRSPLAFSRMQVVLVKGLKDIDIFYLAFDLSIRVVNFNKVKLVVIIFENAQNVSVAAQKSANRSQVNLIDKLLQLAISFGLIRVVVQDLRAQVRAQN